jgi:hypothetical protein
MSIRTTFPQRLLQDGAPMQSEQGAREMSIYCGTDFDDGADWWWYPPEEESPLATKRGRRCCSCKEWIKIGDISSRVLRYRPPTEFEEDRGIAYDEVAMSDWYLCEKCGDLAASLTELGFCFTLGGDSLKTQIKEYMELGK